MLTKTQIIKEARNSVRIFKNGSQWQVTEWMPEQKAWYQNRLTDYYTAMHSYRLTLTNIARTLQGKSTLPDIEEGRWVDFI